MKQGFGLIEVLLSLAIAGMVLTPLIILQGSSSQFAKRTWQRYDRISYGFSQAVVSYFFPKNAASLLPKKNQFSQQSTVSQPAENSALADIANLKIHRMRITNAGRSRKAQDLLIVITHTPKQENS